MDKELESYNCGGFALGLNKWVTPYDTEISKDQRKYTELQRSNIIMSMIGNNISREEFIEAMLEYDTDYLIEKYPQLSPIRLSESKIEDTIVAYRLYVPDIEDPDFQSDDIDFHFRVRKSGQWYEKLGAEDIRKCEFTEDEWRISKDLYYDGSIQYFLLNKI